jgi:AcrR family transcriptional regulator
VEFATHGLAGARIERVAATVALNVRMIYYHFESKEGLYRGVLHRMLARMAAVVPDTGALALEPDAAGLRRLLEGFVMVCAADPTTTRLLLRELLDGAHHLREVLAEHTGLTARPIEAAAQLVALGRRQGKVRDVVPHQTVVQVVAAIAYLIVTREALGLLSGRASPSDRWNEAALDLVLNGALAPGAAGSPPRPSRGPALQGTRRRSRTARQG